MKKKFATVTLALLAALGISALAQEPAACTSKDTPVCARRAPRHDAAKADSLREVMLFEGITLTPEQQTKLAALKADRKAAADRQMKARKDMKDQKKQERADRMKARQDKKRADLQAMKQILTPEQYVVYLENIVVSTPDARMAAGHGTHRAHDMKAMHGARHEKHCAPRK